MLSIDLTGKRAFVAGVADDSGLGFSIAKSLAEAGASVSVGTWPPALKIFETMLRRGKMDASLELARGGRMAFEHVLPLDVEYDHWDHVPAELRESRRYKDRGDFTVNGAAIALEAAHDSPSIDIVVHAIANGPEVKKPLLETSREGYLAAMSASAYSFVSLVSRFGSLVRPGGSFLCLSYLAAERVVPGYGGGMSSAKAALESDTRVLAFEAGRRWGHRVNAISAGPFASRAASAIGTIGRMIEHYEKESPLPEAIVAEEVGRTAAFLASPLASGITGSVVHVDKGFHAMAVPASLGERGDASV